VGGYIPRFLAACFATQKQLEVREDFMFSADPKTDVQGAFAAWDAAFNKGDLKGIAAAYLPNAKLLPPNHEIALGREAIERFYAGVLANSITAHQLELIDAAGNEKIVYSSARWNAKGKDKDGQVTTFSGFATHVFERQPDNSLKLLLQIWN
jgi:ketosteroid isomerase-like protein